MLVGSWCGLHVSCVVFFFVLCGFVLDCGVLVLFHPHCIVYYRVPGLHCAWVCQVRYVVSLSIHGVISREYVPYL